MTAKTLRRPADLAAAGLVAREDVPALERVAARYAIAITPAVMIGIDPDQPDDPIARQFVPSPAELETRAEERGDPIGDEAHSPVPGIVHRYPDRVLLKPLHVCPVYCRFCFRREMVGPDGLGTLSRRDLAAALAYIAERPAIWEVIVTGGDPFVLSPRRLRAITDALARIEHVRVVRFHTRVPVVAPDRVTTALIGAIKSPGQATWVAIHANHPREFSPEARDAVARLADAGIPLVSQSVLLKGINDDPDTLERLMRTFVENRIKPYYLHHGDLAPGTAHFRTTIGEGQVLARELRARASGLAQPTYVLDIPGGFGKVPVGPAYVGELSRDSAGAEICNVQHPRGGIHPYPPRG
jgi:lysine 2,3-aminomutase